MRRRQVLSLTSAVGFSVVAGCLSDSSLNSSEESDDELEGYTQPEQETDEKPSALRCESFEDDEYKRHPQRYETIQVGETDHFSLRINAHSFEYGETAVVTLQNDTSETQEMGTLIDYNLEVSTTEGWQDVRIWTAEHPLVFPDVLRELEPGERYLWELELSDEGVAERSKEGLEVCPPLKAGRYRFTFAGLLSDDDIAVEFNLGRDI